MAGAPTPFRQILENRLSQLAAETETLFAEARERARRELADQLNQAARRLLQAGGVDELAATLSAVAAPFAAKVLVFRVEGEVARNGQMDVALASAPALAGAIQTRDPVVAAATPGELPGALLDLLGHSTEDRVYIFPIVAGESVPALVYASGNVQGPAIELLAQMAAAAWKALTPARPANGGLVTIAPTPAAPAAEKASSWDRLNPEEQQIHLRAQRWARVRVAELRLRQSAAVQAARARRNLYESLREPIDAARQEFRQNFFATCPSMVDYLHLELLSTLAHDDADLLGKDYPGPLV